VDQGASAESWYEKFSRVNAHRMSNPLVAAFEVALRLGQWAVGPEHIFIALLGGKPDGEAAEVMASLGIDGDAFEAELRRRDEHRSSERQREELFRERDPIAAQGWALRSTPAYSRIDGLSHGVSVVRHPGPRTSLDYLLAFLWSGPMSLWPFELDALGVTVEVAAAELVKRGTDLPAAPLPETVRGISIVKFPTAAVASVIEVLSREHPEESGGRWRIEVSGAEATVLADPAIDLVAALREAGAEPVERVV
jgi:hypothetical protein